MRKQVIAWLLIATILALTMPILYTVQAHQNPKTGHDFSYDEHNNFWPYIPCYAECHHELWEGYAGDSMAGIGVQADYTSSQDMTFNWAKWEFEKQWGTGDVTSISGMSIDPCVNGNDHHYYNIYNAPELGYPPGAPYECWFVYFPLEASMNPTKNSVEGRATAAFYHPSDPPTYPNFGEIWWIEAYTQNPDGDPWGNNWSYIYAHSQPHPSGRVP